VALQHGADRLIRDRVPEVGQRPRDAALAPVRMFLGPAHNQWLDVVAYVRSASVSAHLGLLDLLDHERPVPAETRLRLGGVRHVHPCRAAEPVVDVGACRVLRVGQEHTPVHLGLQDAGFGSQILLSKEPFLVHRPGDGGEET